jgi:acyl-CoA dehydrogenase
MSETQLLLDTAERIFTDHCDKQLLDAAETGSFPRDLWQVVADNGLPLLATTDIGGSLGDVMRLLRVAGRHAVPAPLAEALLANHLMGLGGCAPRTGSLTLGIADSQSGEGAEVAVRLAHVPWARSVDQICYVIGDPLEIIMLDVAACDVTPGTNIAGEARDRVEFLGVPERCGSAPDLTVATVFELMALTRCSLMSGALERCLTLACEYAGERKQFGRELAKFQAIQHQLAVMACEVAAALRATDAAIAAIDSDRFQVAVASAKARVGEAAGTVAEIAHQVHGAMGYTHEHRLHHFTRRLLAWRDEYGRETYWQQRLGRLVAAGGADHTWRFIVGG